MSFSLHHLLTEIVGLFWSTLLKAHANDRKKVRIYCMKIDNGQCPSSYLINIICNISSLLRTDPIPHVFDFELSSNHIPNFRLRKPKRLTLIPGITELLKSVRTFDQKLFGVSSAEKPDGIPFSSRLARFYADIHLAGGQAYSRHAWRLFDRIAPAAHRYRSVWR